MNERHEQALLYLKKAKEDEILLDEVIDSEKVADEIFGFHCQQAAEKLLKAVLSTMGVRFKKTHNLRVLMDLLKDNGNPTPSDLADIDALTPYGTTLRYDSFDDSTPFDRQSARKMVCDLRAWVENQVQ